VHRASSYTCADSYVPMCPKKKDGEKQNKRKKERKRKREREKKKRWEKERSEG